MALTPAIAISIPVLSGLIGYGTNYLAVRMLFRPVEPRRVLGLRVQGLVGKRQKDLAKSIGRVVGDHLVRHEDLVAVIGTLDLGALVDRVLDRGLSAKVSELRRLPLVGGFLTDQRVADLRAALVRSFLENKETLYEEIERALEQGLDVKKIVEEKVAAFPVPRLEALVLEVASRELVAIEVLGGVLGLVVGLVQVGWLALL